MLDARIDLGGARKSDLLAFEIAIERGRPLSVMCAYVKVNGAYFFLRARLVDQTECSKAELAPSPVSVMSVLGRRSLHRRLGSSAGPRR